ncbi:MAG: hypothetical protein L3J54_13550 [Draconibacterium sp.]|nr:hypothetical protein [Draconibacterium sp.]
MGITIHFKGKLNSPGLTTPFLEEVEDIAKSMEWNYTVFQESNDEKPAPKGLFIQPHPNSEFLQFMIDKKGHLRNAVMLEYFEENKDSTYYNSIKTQFAPIEIHIAIIKLLKYLKQKYISNLEVWDEGDYWQTGDAKILYEKFDFLNNKLNEFESILNSIEFEKNDTAQSVVDKIEQVLKRRWKKK